MRWLRVWMSSLPRRVHEKVWFLCITALVTPPTSTLTATQPGHWDYGRDSFFLSRLGSAWVYFHKLWLKVVSQTEVWRRFRIPVKWKKACAFMCVCVCVVRASTYVRRINHDRLICPRVTEGKTKCTAEMSSIGLARQKTFSPCVIRVVQSKPSHWHISNRESSKWSLKKNAESNFKNESIKINFHCNVLMCDRSFKTWNKMHHRVKNKMKIKVEEYLPLQNNSEGTTSA